MAENKASEQFGKKEVPNLASQYESDIEIVRSNGPVSEQAQLESTPQNKALPSLSVVFRIKGWNPFKCKGKEISMTNENIGMMFKLLLEESNRKERVKEEDKKM